MAQSLSLYSRANSFIELGKIMSLAAKSGSLQDSEFRYLYPDFYDSLQSAGNHNQWFTPENIVLALEAWGKALNEESVYLWIRMYESKIQLNEPKRVAVIMAGNIPLVGFHDFICTLISGNYFVGKLSSDDKILLPALADLLCAIEPEFAKMIRFTEGILNEFDAIIATGSNNTARYFEYYFSKYPHIIRKNRNGIAVLTGNESAETLKKLGSDICSFFGLGCRNVSKIFIPFGYDPAKLFTGIALFFNVLNNHNKYMNNYSYYRSIYLLNNTPHLDNGTVILTESEQYSSPIPVVYYQYYDNLEQLLIKLSSDDNLIQCIATDAFVSHKTVLPGNTQSPGVADYADGIDTMKFITEL